MYIAYKQNNDLVLRNYLGVGPQEPELRPNQSLILSPALVTSDVPPWSKLSYSFCRLDGNNKTITTKSSYIFAWENAAPVDGKLAFHTGDYGAFQVNFVSGSGDSKSSAIGINVVPLLIFIIMLV